MVSETEVSLKIEHPEEEVAVDPVLVEKEEADRAISSVLAVKEEIVEAISTPLVKHKCASDNESVVSELSPKKPKSNRRYQPRNAKTRKNMIKKLQELYTLGGEDCR